MSLLDRGFSIKKLLKPGWILFIPVFFGCETSDDQGIRYDLDANTSVRFQEFTLPITNFYRDSLATSGEGAVLVGRYTDALTGEATAEGYFQYSYLSGPLPADSLKFDSAELILKAGLSIPLQSSAFLEFSVREMNEHLISGVNYLASLRQGTSDSIGLFSRTINTEADTLLEVNLSHPFGQKIFDQLAAIAPDNEASVTTEKFTDLALVPEANGNALSLIDLTSDAARLILYCSPDTVTADTTYLINFRISGQSYSYLERNQTGSAFEGVQESTNFDLPNGNGVLDPLLGIFPSYSLEGLQSFFDENENVIINSAVVSMQIDTLSDDRDDRPEITQFLTFFRKEDGSIFGPALSTDRYRNLLLSDASYGSGALDPAAVILSEDQSRLLINCTLFSQSLYREYQENGTLALPGQRNQAARPISELVPVSPTDLTFGKVAFADGGIKLRIYYTEVN